MKKALLLWLLLPVVAFAQYTVPYRTFVAPTVVIRGTNSLTNTARVLNMVLPLPAGTQAGDLAILYSLTTAAVANVPSGWTTLSASAGTWGGFVASKILTSGDITTGSVTVNVGSSFGTNGDAITEIAVLVGPTSGVRETDAAYSGLNPGSISTSGAVTNGDIGIIFAGSALPSSGSTISVTPGTVLQSPNTTDAMGLLAVLGMPGGVSTFNFSATGTFTGLDGAVVVVMP